MCKTKLHASVLGLRGVILGCAVSLLAGLIAGTAEAETVTLENESVRYVIGEDGLNLHFIDKKSGVDYLDPSASTPCARAKVAGKDEPLRALSFDGKALVMRFGDAGIQVTVGVTAKKRHFLFRVTDVRGEGIEELTFLNLALVQKPGDPFAGCALALNLQTNVPELPQPNSKVHAFCYPRFGLIGAEAALVGCTGGELRSVIQDVVTAAEELPHSSIGGPWALDAQINAGSYLFNFGGLSEETVDDWIALAKQVGINQIDFHGGSSFRFGDCRPNPETYPNGRKSLKAVIDRLHEAGIVAGLHTYAFFIDKKCPWVTPIPDPRLAKDAVFTLVGDLSADATEVSVSESTEKMSTTTGFFVRNSVTLQIDDELITYAAIQKDSPYAFTECTRGAYGTTVAAHSAGAKVHHLKECFGLFVPDGDSTFLSEVAESTARMFNECGFDMMYLDALDGEDILGGGENGWHYGSKFVFEIWKYLERPALMEMSTFHHHLWYVRSRMGAWDHPTRGHKRFIDIHCQANNGLKRMFLPGHLGWWAVKTWTGIQGEPTFADDIEYLCGKCIGNDVGFSIMGINPGNCDTPAYQRLAAIMRQYEALRRDGAFDESIKARLRVPGDEFTLFQDDDERWRFKPANYDKHKVEPTAEGSRRWVTSNPFQTQPLKLRIETLASVKAYDADDSVTLLDFSKPEELSQTHTAKGVTLELRPDSERVKAGGVSGALLARNQEASSPRGAWASVEKEFSPPINLEEKGALGVWLYGDGRGEVLNFQLENPKHLVGGFAERYVTVDFTGWRYFELVETESERHSQYRWPYGSPYSIYREKVNLKHVEKLTIWCNDLPADGDVRCWIAPVKALPVVDIEIENPSIAIQGKKITFPVKLKTGQYLEFNSMTDCKLYGPDGNFVGDVTPQGDVPQLRRGENSVEWSCDGPTDLSARARVTVIGHGKPL